MESGKGLQQNHQINELKEVELLHLLKNRQKLK